MNKSCNLASALPLGLLLAVMFLLLFNFGDDLLFGQGEKSDEVRTRSLVIVDDKDNERIKLFGGNVGADGPTLHVFHENGKVALSYRIAGQGQQHELRFLTTDGSSVLNLGVVSDACPRLEMRMRENKARVPQMWLTLAQGENPEIQFHDGAGKLLFSAPTK